VRDALLTSVACTRPPVRFQTSQQPFQLGSGKIGIKQQTGPGRDLAAPILAEGRAAGSGAPVLPHNGVVKRPSRGAVPQDGGFALVGDADAGDLMGLHARQGGAAYGQAGLPYLARIMLDPAIGRIDLPQRQGMAGDDAGTDTGDVEQHGAGRGRALVDGEQEAVRGQSEHPVGQRSKTNDRQGRPGDEFTALTVPFDSEQHQNATRNT